MTDFRDVRRASDINQGPDLGGTGHEAMNFTGSVASSGDTWITVYDATPADASAQNLFGSGNNFADVLIHTYNNKKGVGLLALFNEGSGEKGLALIVYNSGNTDTLTLGTVSKDTGTFTALKSVSLSSGVTENVWYRLTMDIAVSGGNVTITGKVFAHATPSDPASPLGGQVGATLTFSGARPTGIEATGEVGMVATAVSATVDSSVTGFTIDP